MDNALAGIISGAVIALGGLGGGWLTSRTAKTTNKTTADANAVAGFDKLTERLEGRLDKQDARITRQDEEIEKLRAEEERKAELQRAHQPWDVSIYEQATAAGWTIGPPPPLD